MPNPNQLQQLKQAIAELERNVAFKELQLDARRQELKLLRQKLVELAKLETK